MSTTIENSVVSMSFDNRNFENNAKTTMSTLDKLRKALDFSGSADTLNQVSAAAGQVDMTPLQNGVQEVHNKFSALEVVAITALANITNKAVEAGTKIARSLTIDSIIGGFGEYELMMNSIQTIMSGTGESLDVVNSKLNELNEYADRTIYVFSDMTQNIGKFTNAGVDLDTAVGAIKGISNEAALSGANAEEASRAMYNIAQALSTGYMQYIDWKSIENANMATIDFKENLVATALDIGTLSEATVKAAPSINALFKDNLKDGWLTNDVLLKTLNEYADETTELGKRAYAAAQDIKTFHQMWDTLTEAAGSGWSQSFQYIFGDFEQAKQLWTGVGNYFGDMIQKSADARNEVLKVWNQSGGRAYVIDGLIESFHALMKVVGNVKLAFQDVFKGIDSSQLMDLSANFYYFAKHLNESLAPVAKDIRHTFDGIFSVMHMGINIITSVGRAFGYLVGKSGIGNLASSLLGVTGNFGEFLKNLDESITKNDTFYKALKKVADALLLIPKGFNAVFESLTGMGIVEAIDKASEELGGFLEHLGNFMSILSSGFSSRIDNLKNSFSGLGTETGILEVIFEGFANGLSKVADVIFDIVSAIGESLTEIFGQADTRNMMDFINTAGLAGTLTAFLTKLNNIMDPLDDMGDMIGNIREDLEILGASVKADVIMKIAKAVGILAVSCILLASVDADKLAAPMGVITGFMIELMGAFAIMDKINTVPTSTGWFSGLQNFGASLNNLMDSFAQSTKATVLLKLAGSVLILADALKVISNIEPERLTASMVAITVLLGELVGAAILMDKFGGKFKGAGFVTMATGLLIVSAALKIIATINPDRLAQTIILFTVALLEMTTALTALSQMSFTGLLAAGASMLAVSAALLVLSASLKILSTIKPDTLAQTIILLTVALLEITTALTVLSQMSFVGLLAGAASLLVAAAAITVLSGALLMLSTLSSSGMNTALTALFASLAMLAAALLVMKSTLPGAAALIVASGAIAILATSLIALSVIPFDVMLKTLLGLGIAIGGFAGAALLLSPVLPVMAALAGVLALFGAACTLVGVGVLALATGLATLAVSGLAGATAFVGILSVIMGAIPMIVNAITLFIQTMIQSYLTLMPLILEAVTQTIAMICQAILTNVPTIVETGLTLLTTLLTSIRDHLPEILQLGIDILTEIMNGIAAGLPQLIDAAFNVIISFIDGLGQAIEDNAEAIRTAMFGFCEHLWNAFCEFFGIHSPSTKMNEGGTFLIQGLINGINSMIQDVVNKIQELKTKILNKLKEKLSEFVDKGKTYMTKVKDGMESKREELKTKASSLVNSIKNKMNEAKNDFVTIGTNFMTGLKDGIESMRDTVVSKASDIGGALLSKFQSVFNIHSPSRVTFGFGQFLDMGLINGMENLRNAVTAKAATVGTSLLDSLSDKMTDVEDTIDDEFVFSPIVRPMVDFSGFQNTREAINNLFNTDRLSTEGIIRTIIDSADSRDINPTVIINNDGLLAEFSKLRNDLDVALNKVANMQVLLDGKSVVGELAPAMDVALGQNSIRVRRGN